MVLMLKKIPKLLIFALILAVFVGIQGCKSSGSEKRSGQEILNYKLAVVKENDALLTEEQKSAILFYPGRSFDDIDQALEQAKEEFQKREEARSRAQKMGVNTDGRRRVSQVRWVKTESGHFRLERVPLDPVNLINPLEILDSTE